MAEAVTTYNCKDVHITFGGEAVYGYAEDSFVTIEPNTDGITKKVGCDGEVARAIMPDRTYKVRIVLMQTSPWNEKLQEAYYTDRETGDGIKDLAIEAPNGMPYFQAPAWVVRSTSYGYGKDVGNREWQFDTASAQATF